MPEQGSTAARSRCYAVRGVLHEASCCPPESVVRNPQFRTALHLSSDYRSGAALITRPFLTKHLAAVRSSGCPTGSTVAAWPGFPRREAGCLEDTNHNSCVGGRLGQLTRQGTELAAEQKRECSRAPIRIHYGVGSKVQMGLSMVQQVTKHARRGHK